MDADDIERAVTGSKVSRRWLLRSSANLTAGLVAVGTIGTIDVAAAAPRSADSPPVTAEVVADHDPATGEIFDRDRHHHWDTV